MSENKHDTIDGRFLQAALNEIEDAILRHGFGHPEDRINVIAYLMAGNASGLASLDGCPLNTDGILRMLHSRATNFARTAETTGNLTTRMDVINPRTVSQ